ncbi:Tetratricopeptide repeat protein [Anatilimnocola aggregata]|uniref:Tetratricopeptide repeat protein n=1 Tax=Anatilimnocola aggregata TaxID=2528021 RepID=A0A517YJK9_9BACT|nr:tetratricopeptide repeat protein [Anatilimnocola aggregata]QDU30409.1 Tetratricopeptide repeat protein [Anatilimnocola aggregata]
MPSPDPLIGLQKAAEEASSEQTSLRSRSAKGQANRGWAAIERGDPEAAIPCFREALRLQPDLPVARAGIVEALKARHPLYRWLLQGCSWLASLPASTQVAVMLAVYCGSRLISSLAEQTNDGTSLLWPLLMLVFGLSALVGIASPLFNLLLRWDPLGRQLLDEDQQRGTSLLLVNLLLPLPLLVWAVYSQDGMSLVVWLLLSLISLPSSAIFRCAPGWTRWVMATLTIALAAIALPLLAGIFVELPAWLAQERLGLIALFVYALIGSQVAATVLMAFSVRR